MFNSFVTNYQRVSVCFLLLRQVFVGYDLTSTAAALCKVRLSHLSIMHSLVSWAPKFTDPI